MNQLGFKIMILTVISVFQLLCFSSAQAAIPDGAARDQGKDTTKDTTKDKTLESSTLVPKLKAKKSTEVNFDDVLVQGKYHFSDEAVTTVEQDKVLDALLGVRTEFKDRLSKSAARH